MVQHNQLSKDAELQHIDSSSHQTQGGALHMAALDLDLMAKPPTQQEDHLAASVAHQNFPTHCAEFPLSTGAPGAPETDALQHAKYRDLARQHLRSLPALFTKFTGLFSHIAWAPTWPRPWNAKELPSRSQICREVIGDCSYSLKRCRSCAARHLSLTLKSGHKGHSFTCWLRVHNFWLPIIVRGCLVGLSFVQALAMPATIPSAPQIPRAVRKLAAGPQANSGRLTTRRGKPMARTEFAEAARLLRLVVHHVETSAVADLRKSDLSRAQEALLELQTVATRLRTELNGLVPAFNKNAPVLEPENHIDRLVRAALKYIHTHFAEPFTLRQCARQLRLNAAYLSAQFSRAVGTPFKIYLTELRAEKARTLLSDPTKSIAEVAYAVGYASPNRFRVAFKQTTGLSPRRWRETLRMEADNSR